MLCYEVWVNGEMRYVVGHPDQLTLEVSVLFHREDAQTFLNVCSILWRKGMEARDATWEAPRLKVGDEVRVKVIESDSPQAPHSQEASGMKMPPPWGTEDERCSFCGGDAAHRRVVFDGPKVKICAECVEFRYRILNGAPNATA